MLTKKDKKKRYNKAIASRRDHQFDGWGEQTAKAFKNNTGGAVGGLVGAASAGITAGMQNAELVGVEETQADVDARRNFKSAASTNDDLLAEMMGATNMKSDFDFKDFMQDGKTLAMNTLNATMQGAASGASAGPWGAVAGAAAGLLGGVGGIIGGRVKAGVEAAQKKEAARRANAAQAQTLTAKAGALDQAADARSLAAYYAEGGQINPFPSSEFGSPITEFNTGGSHEENPYDGIPQGIAPDGLPNLVEEGEVKFDNYIFSDRLMLTKEDKQKYKFLKGKTYADAAKRIKKDLGIDERPNDLIAKTDLEEQLNLLSMLQEEKRAKRGLSGENRMMYAFGGHTYEGTATTPQYSIYTDKNGNPFGAYTRRTDGTDVNKFALEHGATVSNDYEIVSAGTDGATRLNMYRVQVNPGDKTGTLNYYSRDGKGPTMEKAAPEVYYRRKVVAPPAQELSVGQPADGTPPSDGGAEPVLSFDSNSNAEKIRQAYDKQFGTGLKKTNLLQAAPILGNALGALAQAINVPDYKHAKELQRGEQNTFTPVSYTPITQRMTYKPMDVNYYGSKLGAQAGATRQAIRQQTATNPYAATAALLTADANAQGQLGDLYKKAEEYNLAQREKVGTFNRATDQANAEMAMKAQQLNASLQNSAYDRQFKRDAYAQQMKQAEDEAWSKSMSASMTGLFDNLGAMGKEKISQAQGLLKLIGDGVTYKPEMYPMLEEIFGSQGAKRLHSILSQIKPEETSAKKEDEKKAYGGKLKRKRGYTI